MSERKLKGLLAKLHDELEQTDQIDRDTKALVGQLGDDIDRLLQPNSNIINADNATELASALETRFAAKHPVAAKFVQEIIEALAKMGV